MSFDHVLMAGWIQRIDDMLLHSLWQIAIIGLLFTIGRFLIRTLTSQQNAYWTYAWGCLCMFAIVVASLATLFIPNPSEGYRAGLPQFDGIVIVTGSQQHVAPSHNSWQAGVPFPVAESGFENVMKWFGHANWIVVGWLFGVCVVLMRPILGCYNIYKLMRGVSSEVPSNIKLIGNRLKTELGIRREVAFYVSKSIDVPMVFGMFKPVVLMPLSAISGLTAEQLEQLLAHELAHIARNDFLVNLLQTIFEALYFFHPVAWWLSRQIRLERENCCDDMVVGMTKDAQGYATTLATLATTQVDAPSLAAGGMDLLSRIERLVGRQKNYSVCWPVQVCSIVFVGIGLTLFFSKASEVTAANSVKLVSAKPFLGPTRNWVKTASSPQTKVTDEDKTEIALRLIEQQSQLLGISISEQDVTNYLVGVAAQFGETKEEFLKWVEQNKGQHGEHELPQKYRNLNEQIRYHLMLTQMVKKDVVVSEKDIRTEYEMRYGRRAQVLALVLNDQRQAIKVWELLQQRPTAEYFLDLVRQYSVDESSKQKDGAILVRRAGSRPEIAKAAFALKKGEYSPIIEMSSRYIILFSNGFVQPNTKPKIEEKRKQLYQQAYQRKLDAAIQGEFQKFIQMARQPVEENNNENIVRSYGVADLVVPINGLQHSDTVFDKDQWLENDKKFEQPDEIDSQPLIQLIKTTIAPDDWDKGEIHFYEPGLSLLVNHQHKIQSQVEALLDDLRELNATTIQTRAFLFSFKDGDFKSTEELLPDELQADLTNQEARYLYSAAKATSKVRLIEFPSTNQFNGQVQSFRLRNWDGPNKELALNLQIIAGNDLDSTRATAVAQCGESTKTVVHQAQQGKSAIIDLNKLLPGLTDKRLFFVWTSYVIEDSVHYR